MMLYTNKRKAEFLTTYDRSGVFPKIPELSGLGKGYFSGFKISVFSQISFTSLHKVEETAYALACAGVWGPAPLLAPQQPLHCCFAPLNTEIPVVTLSVIRPGVL